MEPPTGLGLHWTAGLKAWGLPHAEPARVFLPLRMSDEAGLEARGPMKVSRRHEGIAAQVFAIRNHGTRLE
jgi:hypothetical protein